MNWSPSRPSWPEEMMPHRLVAVVALVAGAAVSGGCVVDVGRDRIRIHDEKRFAVTGEPDLTLETFDGSMRIRSWDRKEVLVEIEKRGPTAEEADALEVRATQDGDRIRVQARSPRNGEVFRFGGSSPSVSFVASVPRRLRLEARSGDGSIAVRDLDGRIELHSGDGSITGESIAGEISVNTGDGSVQLRDVRGRVAVDTGDGSVHVTGRLDQVRAATGDGSVRLEAFDGSAMKGDWDVMTGDGSVVLRLPDPFDADVDAETGDGRVELTGTSVTTIERGDEGRWLRGRIGRGGRAIRLRTGDGAIQIITP